MEENSFKLPYFHNTPLHNEKAESLIRHWYIDTKKFKFTLASRLVA